MNDEVSKEAEKNAARYFVKVFNVLGKFRVIPFLRWISPMRLRDVNDLPVHCSFNEPHDSNENTLSNEDKFHQQDYGQAQKHNWKRNNEGEWKNNQSRKDKKVGNR